ncbi:AAA family ATPase [Aeromonas salmonicida]|uniref:AAA family ATPase n=1 Tax=Aeromonas salmonicida TaxID=645 RepID=UPI003CFD0745
MENDFQANCFREKPDFGKINKQRTYGSGDINAQAKYLIKNFIPVNSTVGFYGPSGHCKSFLALSVAAHISVGLDWNGNKTSKSAVLYISAEGGNGIHSRIKGWEKRYNDGMKLSNFRVVTDGVILSDEADQEQIWLMCQEVLHDTGLHVGLIVIDTVARCLDGDESSAREGANKSLI